MILSAIFKWYKEDFENGPDGQRRMVLDFVRRYANAEERELLDSLKNRESTLTTTTGPSTNRDRGPGRSLRLIGSQPRRQAAD